MKRFVPDEAMVWVGLVPDWTVARIGECPIAVARRVRRDLGLPAATRAWRWRLTPDLLVEVDRLVERSPRPKPRKTPTPARSNAEKFAVLREALRLPGSAREIADRGRLSYSWTRRALRSVAVYSEASGVWRLR